MQSITLLQITRTSFSFSLKRPFTFAGNTVSERAGFYVTVFGTAGFSAKGEVAPLLGMSAETLKKATHDMDNVIGALQGVSLPNDIRELTSFLRQQGALQKACSSVRFGIESAILSLVAQSNGLPVIEFLGGNKIVPQSAYLLQGTHDQILVDAKDAIAQGYTVLKLKVGSRNIPLDVKNVQDLRVLGGENMVLRLDANRAWSLAEAQLFAQSVGSANIQFIEEPVSNADRLAEFYAETHMPIAIDETLSVLRCGVTAPGRCMPTLANLEGVKAYIIKPMVLGGVIAALDWIKEARQNEKKAIVSSCFETPIGFKMVESIASLSNEAPGLGTQRFYA